VLCGACLALVGLLALSAPASARNAYVANSGDGTVTAFDTETNAPVSTIALGGEPVDIAITPDGRRAWVVDSAGGSVAVIDTTTNAVVLGSIPVGPAPRGIAITPNGGRVYVANSGDDTVTVLSTATYGPVGAPIPIGAEPDGVAISPDGGSVFVAQRGGDISVIDAAAGAVVGTIPDALGPSRLTIGPRGGRGFATNRSSGSVTVFNPATRAVVAEPVTVGSEPAGIATEPDGSVAYAASPPDGTLTQIDAALGLSFGAALGFTGATGVAITPDGLRGYVTDGLGSSVSILDTDRSLGLGAIPVGAKPVAVSVVPNQGPTASFWVSPSKRRAKKRLTFHAGGSTDPDGEISSYAWEFGDRSRAEGPQRTRAHSYRKRGTYYVTLRVTDNEGCSTESVYTGQTASCSGNPGAVLTLPIKVLDPTGPILRIAGRERQRLKGRVVARARCPREACSLRARGTVVTSLETSSKKVRRLSRMGRDGAPALTRTWRRLVLRLPGGTRRSAERALLFGGFAKARITVIARDRSGEVTVGTKTINLDL
jgi:YVTN family beta-propeller protein